MTRVLAPGLLGTLAGGLLTAIGLLILASSQGHAEKAVECTNRTTSLCQTIERCSGGFESNGSCRWNYSVQRYYWGY